MGEQRALRWIHFSEATTSSVPSSMIRSIQQNLTRLGYKPGPADGVFVERVFDAIRSFQCSAGITIDGRPTSSLSTTIKSHQRRQGQSQQILDRLLFDHIEALNLDCVLGVLAQGANPNARLNRGGPLSSVSTAYRSELERDHVAELATSIAKALLDYGAKVTPSNSGVYFAVSNGNVSLLKLLLDNGENAHRKNSGKSLMHWAAYYRQEAVAKLLNKRGVPKLSKREIAQEQLSNISTFRSGSGILLAKKALEDGANINGADAQGTTPLIQAVRSGVYGRGRYELIKFLLDQGADANQEGESSFQDLEGIPLQIFVFMNSHPMNDDFKDRPPQAHVREFAINAMRLLLKHGAKIASRDSKGRTPLHWAAKNGNYVAAKMLLDAGALVSHRDKQGATPIDYAETAEMISLLKNFSGKKKAEDATAIRAPGKDEQHPPPSEPKPEPRVAQPKAKPTPSFAAGPKPTQPAPAEPTIPAARSKDTTAPIIHIASSIIVKSDSPTVSGRVTDNQLSILT